MRIEPDSPSFATGHLAAAREPEPEKRDARDAADYPLITIGIPTRNRAPLLTTCVASVLAQSYRSIEVLVSDNASTDDTLAALKAVDDKRLRVVTAAENIGAAGNFARCISEARGDYLVLLSDDNFLDPSFLEKCARLIRTEPGLPIVVAAYDVMVLDEYAANERRRVRGAVSKTLSAGLWDGADILREYLNGRIAADSLSVVVRTDILRRNNRYGGYRCAGDKATWMPALLEGRAGLINEPCALYLAHGSSLSAEIPPDQRMEEFCAAMTELSAAADRTVSDPARRAELRELPWRYLAYQTMVTLVLYRRAGASLAELVRKLRDWRPLLARCTLRDFLATARLRSWGRIILPPALTRWSIALGLDRLV
jgi:glycosyltransferase involved in cell wall biosynthesis